MSFSMYIHKYVIVLFSGNADICWNASDPETNCMNKEETRWEGKDEELNETEGSFWSEKRVSLTCLGWRHGFKVQ